MKKYTITEQEWENVIIKVRELENESNKLKGYIEALEKQLSIFGVVSSSLKDKEPKCLKCGSNNVIWTMCKDCGNDPFN